MTNYEKLIMDINPLSWLMFPFLVLFSLGAALGSGQQIKSVSPSSGIEYYQQQLPGQQ
jgi:hypothetical protein